MADSSRALPADARGLAPHPIAAQWRSMTPEEYAPFAADIEANGVLVPVTIYEGRILDGVHRARAAKAAGVPCPTRAFTGSDPFAYTVSLNDRRRHLQAGELALAAAAQVTTPLTGGGDPTAAAHDTHRTIGSAAAAVGLSSTTVSEARTVLRCGHTPLIEAVRCGDVSISDGARRARAAERSRSAGAEDLADKVLRGDVLPRRAETLAARYEARNGKEGQPGPKPHPAQYTEGLIPAFAAMLEGRDSTVLDIFAGVGGIHELPDYGPYRTIGIELEPEWACAHPDTIVADATRLPIGDDLVHVVATSPAYGNRLSDYPNGPPADAPERRGYVPDLGRALHPNNGAGVYFGARYKEIHSKAWAEAVRVLVPGGILLLNVVDHWCDGLHVGVAGWHLTHLIQTHRAEVTATCAVEAPSWTPVENGDLRLAGEWVFRLQMP